MMDSMGVFLKRPKKFYSPLRYPGGKAVLASFLFDVIDRNSVIDCIYVEPFAGGAGAALSLLFLEKVDKIIINDLDKAIYSFWKAILNNTEEFINKIERTDVTIDEWHLQRAVYNKKHTSELDFGFATFFLNRTNRSGIIQGRPIGGLNQDGKWKINARFNKVALIERIVRIANYKKRIQVLNLDGIELMRQVYTIPNVFIYIDPPYFEKGSTLYLNHYNESNHKQLADFLNRNPDFYWLLTYDNVQEIRDLYPIRDKLEFNLYYHTNMPKQGKEILIKSDRISVC